jgi:hypothetical protein
MKKLRSVLLLLGFVGAGLLSSAGEIKWEKFSSFVAGLSTDASISFATEYVSHGSKLAGPTVIGKWKTSHAFSPRTKFSIGTNYVIAVDGSYNKVAPCFGIEHAISETFTLDGGFTHYFYTSARPGEPKNSGEIYGGIFANTLLAPAFYVFCDFDSRDLSAELSLRHEIDLSQVLSGLTLNLGGKIGCEHAKKSGGRVISGERKTFCYYGIGADLRYRLKNSVKAQIGLAYEGNSARKSSWVNANHRNFVWFNGAISFCF